MCWSDLRKSGRCFLDVDAVLRKERGGWKEPLRFLLLLQAIGSVLWTLALYTIVPLLIPALPVPAMDAESVAGVLIGNYLGSLVLVLAWAAWLHLWVAILGGRAGLLPTFRAVVYGSSPRFWFFWVPLVSFFFVLWAAVNTIIGIRALQKLSTRRAIASVAIAILIALLFLAAAVLFFGAALLAV